MSQQEPYFANIEVPQAALLERQSQSHASPIAPHEIGAVWYFAKTRSFSRNDARAIQHWEPALGLGEFAVPVTPNQDNARIAATGGLEFMTGVNSGLVANSALIDPEQFTLAIRYASPINEARSLLTVNPRNYDSYLSLSEKENELSLQFQHQDMGLSCPAPNQPVRWAVAGYRHGQVSLGCTNHGEALVDVQSMQLEEPDIQELFSGICDLFIGCRSHRKGILKTLGQSQIFDVLLWIDQDLCGQNLTGINQALRHCEIEGAADEL